MNIQPQTQHTIKQYHLAILCLVLVMLSRLTTAVGAPHILNFFHFILVSLGLTLVFIHTSIRYKARVKKWLLYLSMLFGTIVFSAIVNNAGLVNILLEFLLLSEPFLFLFLMTSNRWSHSSIQHFKFGIIGIILIHTVFAYYQYWLLGLRADDVKGVFLEMGAGSHIAGAVSLTAAVYLFYVLSRYSRFWRLSTCILLALVVIFSDAKQVIAAFLAASGIMILIRLKNIKKALRYVFIFCMSSIVLLWAANTIFPALKTWVKIDLLITGFMQKFSVFPLIISHYHSWLNWFFGLGPGHTVGRLGWLIPKYATYLTPFGITSSPVTEAIWTAHQNHWISNPKTGSSLFSLLFSWSGIWGDLGGIGLMIYLSLWWVVWKKFCPDDMTKFFLLTIVVFGVIFSWMEEPGYMLFVMSIIGLQWQEQQYRKRRLLAYSSSA